ncbi:lipid IV(A) 3-deoxy-D-manno-octulosonic acid transferase [Vibrio sp. 10N]|uniref:lipid IV(A) 3-deoxy-D-manno-octulosonic acid transferase n=1 Tax=Vibrio sp. 10N TaxID=3058938 RepID=UPI0028146498|nr:lipid IV(A) 3-deoxy-D-manno-octulosonic acid transferase [Vibrio sp. 10N]
MIVRFVYTLLLTIVAPLFLYGLFKAKPGKPSVGKRWREHFGWTPKLATSDKPVVWFHAVSVGETLAVTPLIKQFASENPDTQIVITTTTPTGAEQAEKLSDIATHRYMPLDFGFAIKRFLRLIKPSQMVIVETELWPNTLHIVAKAGVPITVINARLSERSCRRYQKVQPLFNVIAPTISTLCCQFDDDASRFERLGIAPERIQVTGSIKFDIQITDKQIEQGKALRKQLGQDRPVWIAASTHDGEDEQVLTVHKQLLQNHPELLLIVVPRHPERFESVAKLCKDQGFGAMKRTELNSVLSSETSVVLGNTMGEMMSYLAASDVCFMGGSLLGKKVGGHNLLEPAALGLPVLTGPSYFNFTDITEQLVENDGAIICQDTEQISIAVSKLIEQSSLATEMGIACKQVVNRNQGALRHTLDRLSSFHITEKTNPKSL